MDEYDDVVTHFRKVGKHFVPADITQSLVERREQLLKRADDGGHGRQMLRNLLDNLLDKHDGRYCYATYLALNILPFPDPNNLDPCTFELSPSGHTRDRLLTLLIADLLRFEARALRGEVQELPRMRPPREVVRKRCRHAIRAARTSMVRLDVIRESELDDEPIGLADRVTDAVFQTASPSEERFLRLSLIPVFTAHDEYLFIRTLQSFELTFALLAIHLRSAIFALVNRDAETAIRCVNLGETTLREAAPLFSLLATMPPPSFHAFREYTDGASAIQSENYKRVESLCREPETTRLHSVAYESVPSVRDAVLSGQLTLRQAILDLDVSDASRSVEVQGVLAAMSEFESTFGRWRQTHYTLAKRMLGDSPGTGNTEGTPYLSSVREIAVFDIDLSSGITESAPATAE